MARQSRKNRSQKRNARQQRPADRRGLHPHISLVSEELSQAVTLHQQGDWESAAAAYRRILEREPTHAEAMHLLGVIDHQSGRHLEAIDKLEQALNWRPDATLFRKNLASAYRSASRFEEARRICHEVLAYEPHEAVMFILLGRMAEAETNWQAAIEHYEQALACPPPEDERIELLVHLGDCYSRVGEHDRAAGLFQEILQEQPRHLVACHNLAREYQSRGNLQLAADWYQQALEIDPACASAWNNLGVVRQMQTQFMEARQCLERARELAPQLPDVHNNLANILETLGQAEGCRELLERAVALRPDYAEAWHSLGQWHLRQRDFPLGWEYYRWRYHKREHDHRHYPFPIWREIRCQDQSLLIFSEQGIGDVVMFATCLPDLWQYANQVTLEVDARMVPLFARSFPQAHVIPRPATDHQAALHLPGIDLQFSIADLPERYRRCESDFPRQSQLLQADKMAREKWRQRYDSLGPGLKVGISWFGGKNPEFQARRSIPLADWREVLTQPDVHFINLQYGPAAADRHELENELGLSIHDWADSDPLRDLDDFAAKLAELDLVISIDNATIHFAGALGVPTWCLLTTVPDWRWGLETETSLWYASLRLFRQSLHAEWTPVLTRVAQELRQLAEHHLTVTNQTSPPTSGGSPLISPSTKQHVTNRIVANKDAVGRSQSTAVESTSVGRGNSSAVNGVVVATRPRCAIISPVGPGHLGLYSQAENSVRDACVRGPGGFREIIPFRLEDLEGKVGRSRARNFGVQQAAEQGIEWVFFLDADDLLVPDAFVNAEPYLQEYDAIWGAIFCFQDGSQYATRREGQLGKTESLEDILTYDPFYTLQMGHFVRTEVALAHPFNEEMDAGEDFDYYLRVWEQHRCIKIDEPLFANRRGAHSSGPRSATGRDWTEIVNRMLAEHRRRRAESTLLLANAKTAVSMPQVSTRQTSEVPVVREIARGKSQDKTAVDQTSATGMKLAIYGMMRSGTTLLCDLFTVPGEGLILLEPNLHLGVRPDQLYDQLLKFGIHIDRQEWAAVSGAEFRNYFDQRILPELQRLTYWGVKMVNCARWQEFLEAYPPQELLLCVRDIRDVVLSALDLAPKLAESVDEDWIEQRAIETAQELVQMSALSRHVLRYEDFCQDPEQIIALAGQLGLPRVGERRLGLEAVPHRLYEQRKHGSSVSTRSVGRYASEPPGPARELADQVWKQCQSYCECFGYEAAQSTSKSYSLPPQVTVGEHSEDEHPIAAYWKQDRLANIIPSNNQLGQFPEGWDVRPALWEVLQPHVQQRVIEIGCGYGRLCQAFPADKYLGLDINPDAIQQANETHSEYQFRLIGFEEAYPAADAILAYTVLLHIDDASIGPMLERLCAATDVLMMAEILGRKRWRRSGNPPVFNRDLEDYISLMRQNGFRLAFTQEHPYQHYPETYITFMKFLRE